MKRFIAFLLLAFCSVSAIGQEQIALSATQHFRPRWVQGNNPRQQLTNLLSSDGATVADYQPGNYTGTLNASAWANSIGAAPSLAQASGAAQPIILPYSGQKYLANFGVNGNYASTPASAATNFIGSRDIIVRYMPNSVAPAAYNVILDNWTSTGPQGFTFSQDTGASGELFYVCAIGGASKTAVSTATLASVGITAGTYYWFRVSHNTATGDVNFYYAADQATPPTSWTQLGNTISITPGTITGSTAVVSVGARNVTLPAFGNISRAQLYNGINGTLAVDFNASDWPETTTNGATAVSSTTGETWTLANTGTLLAQIVGSPQLLFDGAAYYMQMATTLVQPEVVIAVMNIPVSVTAQPFFDGTTANNGKIYQGTGALIRAYAGTTFGSQSFTANRYMIVTAQFNGADPNSFVQLNNAAAATGSSGSSNMGGLTVGANGSATVIGNMQVKEIIILNAVPSAAKLANILNLLNQIYHLYAPYVGATDWLGDPMWRYAANDDYYRKVANQ